MYSRAGLDPHLATKARSQKEEKREGGEKKKEKEGEKEKGKKEQGISRIRHSRRREAGTNQGCI